MKTAGVIGGHDFLGCDVTLKLLSENYRVKLLIAESAKDERPLIRTGLKASDQLLFCRVNIQNQLQLNLFLEDCHCLIHCGTPYLLEQYSGEGNIYVPVISNTINLLKSIRNIPQLGKIIFLTSVSAFNHFDSTFSPGVIKNEKSGPVFTNNYSKGALHHSARLIDNVLNDFSDDQIEIVMVSPVVVLNNSILNRKEATLQGLRYMFRHKIEHDVVFQRLLRRKLLNTMVDVIDLPDRVFNLVESYRENNQVLTLPENMQF